MKRSERLDRIDGGEIAIVGMGGRFPGARDVEQFWANVRDGVESREEYSDQELRARGLSPGLLRRPTYVKSGFPLDDIDLFDAEFFGFNPMEAATLDPQHRLMLECAVEVLENAGYDSRRYEGPIGIFAGATLGSYLNHNVAANPEVVGKVGLRQLIYGSVPDYMVTRTSYKLNLRGPSCFVQTACSTSLVALHLGCQSLENRESDMVLAGGVSVSVPQRIGYAHEEGGMESPDGIVRTFDAGARGTVFGNGIALVLLKRLADAVADGDTIHAVIRGTAMNNDGSRKVGFTAPSVEGQAKVISEALATSGVSPASIGYVEAHGTGTELGDPIEVAALTRAFGPGNGRRSCAIGSVKPNVGHLDAAAGVTSLIKVVMALRHRQLPPLINFTRPNPKIRFDEGPFYLNLELCDWPAGDAPRRAAVSAFGFGGTNAHVIVEEAPPRERSGPSRSWQLLSLSARTETALEAASARLADYLERADAEELPDVAFTLHVGRTEFAERRAVLCRTSEEAAAALRDPGAVGVLEGHAAVSNRPIVFLFPGQGTQYVDMGLGLYRSEPVFRDSIDECCGMIGESIDFDLRATLYPADEARDRASEALGRTATTQLALFVVEWSLLRLWASWGVRPAACIGHSIGEYVAACAAGVLELEDALRLVALRGQLMDGMPAGSMLGVSLSEAEVSGLLDDELSLAAVNSPSLCTVSGSETTIDRLSRRLEKEGISCRRLHTSHAFHSPLMDGAVAPFVEAASRIRFRAPTLPYLSNVTGDWASESLVTDPAYWGRQLRQPVLLSRGVGRLAEDPDRIYLEVGPGQTLVSLVRQQLSPGRGQAFPSLRAANESASDEQTMLGAVARLWLAGASVDCAGLYRGQRRHRVALPTYPFERKRHWIDPARDVNAIGEALRLIGRSDLTDWFYVPTWKRTRAASPPSAEELERRSDCSGLVFGGDDPETERVAQALAREWSDVVVVQSGDGFEHVDDALFRIDPTSREDHRRLLDTLRQRGRFPGAVVHLWGLDSYPNESDAGHAMRRRPGEERFFELLSLAQALGDVDASSPLRILIVTRGVHDVLGTETLCPEAATVLGPCRVIPQEFPGISCRQVDVADGRLDDAEASMLVRELDDPGNERVVALRHGRRWLPIFEPVRLEPDAAQATSVLRREGVYLITGGLGGIGLVLAEHLARTVRARLVLVGRSGLPTREEWDAVLARSESSASTVRGIRAVQAMEETGAEVLVARADVCDEDRMRSVLEETIERFGRLDGVIHAAGLPGRGMIQPKRPESAEAVLAPKVAGTRVLGRVLEGRRPDFLLLCSSLASQVGGLGQVDYCAANAYLDAFAREYAARTGTRTVAIDWNAWHEVGMAVETELPEALEQSIRYQLLANSLSNRDGVDAFDRILANETGPQIAVSCQDVQALVRLVERTGPAGLDAHDAAPALPVATQPRPRLPTPYVAPRNEVEKRICTVWQEMLGIENIGVHDSFFELGGHSLLAVTLMSRVNRTIGGEIPVARLYEGLTVSFLAALVGTDREQDDPPSESEESLERRRQRAEQQRQYQSRRRRSGQR